MNIYVNGRFHAHRITGVQRVAHEITRRLAGAVEVCQPKHKLSGWQGHLWEQTALPRLSRNGLLWSPCASGPIAAACQVVTFHDLFVLDFPQFYKPAYVSWYAYASRKLAHSARHLIAVSEYTKRRLIAHFAVDESKITVVHNGVDAAWLASSRARSHHALQLPSARYLLTLGSLEPRKNLATLFAAWAALIAELPEDLWLVVAGARDENIYRALSLADSPPRVFFTGYVPDELLPSLYSNCLAFVYPSLAEGFGLPPLEAMACGAPVLVSNSTALPEVCSDCALYFDPTQIGGLARSIKLIVADENLRRNLSCCGREHASRFNWERAANETLSVLRAIASPAHFVFC